MNKKMFKAFISILAILAVTSRAGGANVESDGKDGFNFYKDYLRGRSDDYSDIALAPAALDRISYFYGTPMQMSSETAGFDQDYKKRTGNAFKHHMLSKDTWAGGNLESVPKRSSKAGLSYIMRKQNPYLIE